MNLKISRVLHTYLRQDKRITNLLDLCISIFQQQNSAAEQIKNSLKKITEPLRLFKGLVLIHNCLIHGAIDPLKAIQVLSLIPSKSKPENGNRLDYLIHNQVINQYVLYLQKCFKYRSEAQFQLQIQPFCLVYRSLNLLKLGVAFVQILYTFGRYFRNQYSFIIDFNITLAKDFTFVYEKRIKKILKNNKQLWCEEMKQELEKLHEKMYIVYYNCYFYQELKGLIPRFIDTESSKNFKDRNSFLSIKKTNENKMNRSSITKGSLTKGSSTNLSFSTIFSKGRITANCNNLMNSTLIGKANGKSDMSESYISEFTCDISDKKEQLVAEQQQQIQSQNENIINGYKIIQSIERVIQAINENELRRSQIVPKQLNIAS